MERRVYIIGPHLTEDHEVDPEWKNEPRNLKPGPYVPPLESNPMCIGTGFPLSLPRPRLVFGARLGVGEPFDAYQYHPYWCISQKLKDAIFRVDPGAFDVVETDTRLSNGQKAPSYWLAAPIQFCDCLDEQRSTSAGARRSGPRKRIDLTPDNRANVFFDECALGQRSIFILPSHWLTCLCTGEAKQALEAEGVTNLNFTDIGGIGAA